MSKKLKLPVIVFQLLFLLLSLMGVFNKDWTLISVSMMGVYLTFKGE